MTITVTQPEKINVVEGLKIEFKTSAFYAPGEQNPGFKQMRMIAETVAAFINTEGGDLYIGVADDGTVRGISGDLGVLATMASSVALKQPKMNDADFAYKATTDHYQLKLQHILQAFLSPNHAKYVSIGFGKVSKTSQTLSRSRLATRRISGVRTWLFARSSPPLAWMSRSSCSWPDDGFFAIPCQKTAA